MFSSCDNTANQNNDQKTDNPSQSDLSLLTPEAAALFGLLNTALGARIDALGAQLSTRVGALESKLEEKIAHVETQVRDMEVLLHAYKVATAEELTRQAERLLKLKEDEIQEELAKFFAAGGEITQRVTVQAPTLIPGKYEPLTTCLFHAACLQDNLPLVRALHKIFSNVNPSICILNVLDQNGKTPLYYKWLGGGENNLAYLIDDIARNVLFPISRASAVVVLDNKDDIAVSASSLLAEEKDGNSIQQELVRLNGSYILLLNLRRPTPAGENFARQLLNSSFNISLESVGSKLYPWQDGRKMGSIVVKDSALYWALHFGYGEAALEMLKRNAFIDFPKISFFWGNVVPILYNYISQSKKSDFANLPKNLQTALLFCRVIMLETILPKKTTILDG